MKIFILFLAVGLLAPLARAQELTWPQLVQHSELWPAQCHLKHSIDFQSGAHVKAGETVDVLAIHAQEIEVGATAGKNISFDVKPDDTDALDMARAAYAKLTPKQRALTYQKIFQDHSLWPYRLTLKSTLDLGGGHRVNKGDGVVLYKVEGNQLLVGSEKLNTQFDVDPQDTDLMELARGYVESPSAAPCRLAEELQPNLINSASGQPHPLNTNALPRYFVFLRGANSCPITQRFMPAMVKFYNETKAKHPEFEVIYLSCDASTADMEKFAQAQGFSWPAVSYQRSGYLSQVMPNFHAPIPQVTVMDRAGHVVATGVGERQNGIIHTTVAAGGGDKSASNPQHTAMDALQQFAALLDNPAAKP